MSQVPRRRSFDLWLPALAALVLASTVARFALSRGVESPWIPDEQLYGLLARSLAAGDGLRILGESAPYYSVGYPLLLAPLLGAADLASGLTAVQALQALLMSLTAVPVYLWARPVAGSRAALLAAGLTVLLPGLVYSGLLMSEALYFPVAIVAVWSMARCLEKPTWARQGLLLGMLGLALATRLQAVGLVVALVGALALLAASERTLHPFRRLLPTLSVLGAVVAAWTVARVSRGGLGEIAGGYSPLVEARTYALGDVTQEIAWHLGMVALMTLALPLVALGLLSLDVLRGREDDPRVRTLVVTAAGYAVVTVVEIGAFASRFVDHVTERQLLSVAPPLFVVFAVWLHRGAPRPLPASAIVAWVVAGAMLLVPVDRLAIPQAAADAPSPIALERLARHAEMQVVELVYAAAAALLLLLVVVVPRRAVPALAAAVALVLGAGSLLASGEMRARSQSQRHEEFAGASPDWIDRAHVDRVALFHTGERPWTDAWQQVFWNDAVDAVARLPEAEMFGALPQTVVAPRFDGRLFTPSGEPFDRRYVVAPSTVSIVGEPLASVAPTERPGLTLWRAEPPLRISQWVRALEPNGDLVDGTARIDVFACGRGSLELTLLGKQGLPTRIRREGELVVERRIPPGTVWQPSVPAPETANGRARCVYELESEGLVGSTRIEFVRFG